MSRQLVVGLRKLVAPLALAAFAPLLPACAATYDHTEITQVGTGVLTEEASSKTMSIIVGDVLTADIVPYNTDDNPMVGDVSSDSPSTVTVLHTATGGYALLGVAIGTAHLTLYADGASVGGLEATVFAQDAAQP